MSTLATTNAQPAVNGEEAATNHLLQPQRGARERELLQVAVSHPFIYTNLTCLNMFT